MLKEKLGTRHLLSEIILRSYIEVLNKHRASTMNNDNIFMREVKGLHHNATSQDLPEHLKKHIDEATQSMLGFIQAQGFTLQPKS